MEIEGFQAVLIRLDLAEAHLVKDALRRIQ
jgi:hypothetical protein